VGVSIQRIHLHLSKRSLARGRQEQSGKFFSERWAGKVKLRTPEKSDRRGTRLTQPARTE
jgi:hypothetical protein